MSSAQILVVEDEAIVAAGIRSELENFGYSVSATASSGEEAIHKAEGLRPDLVLMDVVLKGDMDGIDAAKQIRQRFDIPVIFLTAYEDDQTLDRAKVSGPFGYLLKPFEERELHRAIEMAFAKHDLEQKIKAAERWLNAVLRSIADAVIATDAWLNIRALNPAAEKLTGWRGEDARGRPLSEVCPLAGKSAALESLVTKAARERTSLAVSGCPPLIGLAGRATPVEGSVAPIHGDDDQLCGMVLVLRDVSERQELEKAERASAEHQRHAEKVEAIGRLAGGVAHDFNNLLTAMLGNTSLARAQLPTDHPTVSLLKKAETAGERAAELVKQLQGVSGHSFLRMQALGLADCLHETEKKVRRLAEPQGVVDWRLADDLWGIQADASQIRAAILNLCRYGLAAMPVGGRLLVQAENIIVAEPTRLAGRAGPGDYVRLRIQHMGLELPPEIRARIFEPFFGAQPPGDGPGLGLALAFGIVEQHRGWIECSSDPQHGTSFDVYLPRYGHETTPQPAPVLPARLRRNRTTTILLADDEPMLRELGRTILENQGYHVLLAEDGVQAVEIFQRERHLIDLVILDLTMPRLSGNDACRQILEIDPGVHVLFSSGYFAEALTAGGAHVLGFLKKPYRHDELVNTVRAALEQSGAPDRDVLLMLIKRLEQVLAADLAGREQDWLEGAEAVLGRIEETMDMREAGLQGAGALLADAALIKGGRSGRQLQTLRGRYADFRNRARRLQQQLAGLLEHARSTVAVPSMPPGPTDDAADPGAFDVTTVRRQLQGLHNELENHRQDEINLVLESITLDTGGGGD